MNLSRILFRYEDSFIQRFVSAIRGLLIKQRIQKYYRGRNINVVGFLEQDIAENEVRALVYVHYAIKKLTNVNGVPQLLKDIAEGDKQGKEGGRIYHNRLAELHAVRFVHESLKLQVLEVDSTKSNVLSPNRKGDKSCDIRARDCSRDYYFECKDASSEITTSYQSEGLTHFTPMFVEQVKEWIVRKSKEADEKGANYLVARVPVWSPEIERGRKYFYGEWACKVFNVKRRLSKNTFSVSLPTKLSRNFEGVYVIKAFGHLKVLVS